MSEETLSYLWQNVMDRFLAEGAIYRELRDLQQQIARYEDWRSAWAEVARATEARALRLLESDCTQTAAGDLWRSSIYYFFAQFLLWDDAAAKRATYRPIRFMSTRFSQLPSWCDRSGAVFGLDGSLIFSSAICLI